MDIQSRKIAGALAIAASLQFFLVMLIAETLTPGFSRRENYISELANGTFGTIFNASVILSGILLLGLAFLAWKWHNGFVFPLGLALSGIGITGVGLFPISAGPLHTFFSYLGLSCASIAAALSSKFAKRPFSIIFLLLGSLSIFACILFVSGTDFSLGMGSVERLIVYPFIIWGMAFGVFLIGDRLE